MSNWTRNSRNSSKGVFDEGNQRNRSDYSRNDNSGSGRNDNRGDMSSTSSVPQESLRQNYSSRSNRKRNNPLKSSLNWARERENEIQSEDTSYT